jgi:hypothetical protein
MTPFEKFFIYAFTTAIEKYRYSPGALQHIDEILETPDDILWLDLLEAIKQARRLSNQPEAPIDMEQLKKLMQSQMNKRC